MTKGMYQAVRQVWKKPTEQFTQLMKHRLIEWRQQHTVVKIEKPTRIDRAREVGYKAKQGYVIARVKVVKGGANRRKYGRGGRKPISAGLTHFTPGKSKGWIAEEKAARKFPNLEVLNSYEVGEDGVSKWFEVILVDPNNPNIRNDQKIKWITNPANRKRVLRGLTSAGKKARGLR